MEDSTQATPYSRRLGGEESYWTMGYLMTWLAEGKDTDGRFSLVDVVAPKGTEPPPTHSLTRRRSLLHLGGRVHLPGRRADHRGGAGRLRAPAARHPARPAAEEPCEGRALIVITPAGLEEAFKQVSEPARAPTLPPPPEEPPNIEEILGLFREYGVEFAPPPPPL